MAELRFDGRVAIITGAGGIAPSLGSTYAHYLAARGARVVVNDIGLGPDPNGSTPADADRVVAEIRDAGGEAVADRHSVADPDGAEQIVRTALDAFGRVDVLVNNAGTVGMSLVEDWDEAAIRRDVDTNLLGAIWMSRAVWPVFRSTGGGRIVNISSHSAFGSPYLAVHGAVKAAVFGLTRGLALEGMPHGIRVNALAPQALTVKHTLHLDADSPFLAAAKARTVDQVAPALAYLAHESADLTGRFLYAGGGVVREYLTVQTEGIADPGLTLETLAARLADVEDPTGAVPVPVPDPSIYALMTPKGRTPS